MFFNKKAKLLKQKEEELLLTQTELFQTKETLDLAQAKLTLTEDCLQKSNDQTNELQKKYSPIIDIDKILGERQVEIDNTQKRLIEFNEKYQTALKIHSDLEKEINLYEESLEIGSFGLYAPQFGFETSEQY